MVEVIDSPVERFRPFLNLLPTIFKDTLFQIVLGRDQQVDRLRGLGRLLKL